MRRNNEKYISEFTLLLIEINIALLITWLPTAISLESEATVTEEASYSMFSEIVCLASEKTIIDFWQATTAILPPEPNASCRGCDDNFILFD